MANVDKEIKVYRPDTTEGQTLTVDSSGRTDVGSWLGTAVTLDGGLPRVEADAGAECEVALSAFDLDLVADGSGIVWLLMVVALLSWGY